MEREERECGVQLESFIHLPISPGSPTPSFSPSQQCWRWEPNDEVWAVSDHLVNVCKEVQQGPVAHSCGTPVLRVIVTNTQLPNYQSYY